MAGIKDFYRGDTLEFEIDIQDSDENPIDITGATVWFTMKENPADPDNLAAIQIRQTEHINAVDGKTKIIVPSNLTDRLTPNKSYFYDFQITFASGVVKTIMVGKVKVLQDITLSK